MAEDGKTYQPGWGEKKRHHHHHHHHSSGSTEKNRGYGGAIRMKDKQAYYGIMCVIICAAIYGLFRLGQVIAKEVKAMPLDDPTTERKVDELRIHKAEEEDALLVSDSLAQAQNLDSIRKKVQIETRPVYRPPRRENEWYITMREWKEMWQELKDWRK
jgi:hypothetical protein